MFCNLCWFGHHTQCFCWACVDASEKGVVQNCGKFSRIAEAGTPLYVGLPCAHSCPMRLGQVKLKHLIETECLRLSARAVQAVSAFCGHVNL